MWGEIALSPIYEPQAIAYNIRYIISAYAFLFEYNSYLCNVLALKACALSFKTPVQLNLTICAFNLIISLTNENIFPLNWKDKLLKFFFQI